MIENITEEELHELINADLPKLRFVRYDELLLVDKMSCFLTKLGYGVRLWGAFNVKENVLLFLDGMPNDIQREVAKIFLEGLIDPFECLYLKGGLNKYKSKRKPLLWLCGIVFLLFPLIGAAISKIVQIGVLKRKIYLDGGGDER